MSCPWFQWKYTSECLNFARKCCTTIKTPFTQLTDFYWKKLPQINNATAMLIWCLKLLKDYVLKLSKSIFELVRCNTCFFSFRCMRWWGGWHIYIYIYIYLFKPPLIMWWKLNGMMKSQDFKASFTFGAPILKIYLGISVIGWLYLNMEWAFIYFFPYSLNAGIHFLQFLNG